MSHMDDDFTPDENSKPLSGSLGEGFDPAVAMKRLKAQGAAAPGPVPNLDAPTITAAEVASLRFYSDAAVDAPAEVIAAGEAMAAAMQRLPEGSMTIGGVGGPNDTLNGITRREMREEEEEQEIKELGIQLAEQREQDLKRWREDMHTYAGVTMSGEEWDELGNELSNKDSKLRRWYIDRLKSQGKTAQQAEQLADKVALRMKMNGLPESQWTPEMKALDAEMNSSPTLKAEVDSGIEAVADQAKRNASLDREAVASKQEVSVDRRSDLLAEEVPADRASQRPSPRSETASANQKDGLFTSAPDLTTHHAASLAATKPLDVPKPATPTVVAAAPAPSDAGGLSI